MHTVSRTENENPVTKHIPWVFFAIIAGLFFFTSHDIFHSRDAVLRSAAEFNPSTEEAEEILVQYERGTPLKGAAYLGLGAFSLVCLVIQFRLQRLHTNGLLGGAIVLLGAWAVLSLAWADDRLVAFNKLAIFVMLCLAALAAAQRFSYRDILVFTFVTCGAYLLIGVGAEIVFGAFRPWSAGYRFAGTIHPNGQGMNCALLLLSAIFLTIGSPIERRKWFALAAVAALVCLVFTKSRTPLGLVMITLGVYWMLRSSLQQKVFAGLAVGTGVCFLAVFGSALSPVLGEVTRFGRTDLSDVGAGATLGGRVDLWMESLSYFWQRPILGYGYNSFWTAENSMNVASEINWVSGSAHSIYFEALLGLGIVGFVCLLFIFGASLSRLLREYLETGDPVFAFLWTTLLFAALHGLMESAFIFPAFYSFVIMLIFVRLGFSTAGQDEVSAVAVTAGRAAVPVR